MAIKQKRGKVTYWLDGEGLPVPVKYIDKADKERDELVEELVSRARRLSLLMRREKEILSEKLAKYLDKIAKDKGEKWQGNAVLHNFSMDKCAKVKVHKHIVFDEKLQLAKQKIDRCIMSWSPGSNDKIVALVNRAFQVDKKGKVDRDQIISLRQMQFDDPLWVEAMDLIADSQKVQGTKTYFYFLEAGEDGKLEPITMDFAAL